MHARHVVRICIRATAIGLLISALLIIAPPMIEPALWRDTIPYLERPIFVLRHYWKWVIPLVLIAGTLWILQKPLARLIVPRFGPTCPECGYDLRGSKGRRCPECGAETKRP
jgi:hypothetical protein